jgi:hypothetical protein
LANVICRFGSDTARDVASAPVVDVVDRFSNDALFRGCLKGRGFIRALVFDQLDGNVGAFQDVGVNRFKVKFQRSPVRPLLVQVEPTRRWKRGQFRPEQSFDQVEAVPVATGRRQV